MQHAITQWLFKQLGDFCNWLMDWCKSNIDFALILAVCTETPRWTVTFMAIHEPLWIGIALGVLLAFATSTVWRFYFATKSKTTLVFNVAAIVLAVAVISPVLFAMIEKQPEEVNVAEVLRDENLRWAWSVALALTTFVPLVQLAAVHGAQMQPIRQDVADDEGDTFPISEFPGLQVDLAAMAMQQQQAEDASRGELVLHDDRLHDDRLHDVEQSVSAMLSEGLDAKWIATKGLPEVAGSQLATLLSVNASTISRWRNKVKETLS